MEPTDVTPSKLYRSFEDENNLFSQQWHKAQDLARAHLILAQNKYKENYYKNIKHCAFETNDKVLLKEMKPQTGKFYLRWDGPLVVKDKI